MAQCRLFANVRIGDAFEQMVAEQRGIIGEARLQCQAGGARFAQQIEDEVERGTFARHIVLEIAVQFFIAEIERGREADQERIYLARLQAKRPGNLFQARRFVARVQELCPRFAFTIRARFCRRKHLCLIGIERDGLAPTRAEGPRE